jgi:cyclopropane fatty-acyl-phospholipid synthase-like methyltransferase
MGSGDKMYKQVIEDLRNAYDQKVSEREDRDLINWKAAERSEFLTLLQNEGHHKLLEIGAGTGLHGKYFQNNGLDVICTDLSPNMVACCQEKGLQAYTMDFLNLDFPSQSFDAVFAMNCLLHVPRRDLPQVLKGIRELLNPKGLFYWGQYGGIEQEGVYDEDHYSPKRFFSFLTDEQFTDYAARYFELFSFNRINLEGDEMHYHRMILRNILV